MFVLLQMSVESNYTFNKQYICISHKHKLVHYQYSPAWRVKGQAMRRLTCVTPVTLIRRPRNVPVLQLCEM